MSKTGGSSGSGPADYLSLQGTSMASPTAAGVAALILSKNSSLTPAMVRQAMQATTTDKGDRGSDSVYGWGLINAAEAVNYYQSGPGSIVGGEIAPVDRREVTGWWTAIIASFAFTGLLVIQRRRRDRRETKSMD
ncbi:MAG: S8 family serine peptidase [Dehalococcoidales bacterium]|nr:S8 family serine peptidase [Dehalococcoidales bacterium]